MSPAKGKPAQIKFEVKIESPKSGVVGHVVRAETMEAAGERALRAYPKAQLLSIKLVGA